MECIILLDYYNTILKRIQYIKIDYQKEPPIMELNFKAIGKRIKIARIRANL